ncbi:hypothetical protein [Longimicrobium sp.]|uniref:hypothetical protein n=1 Tax=Longimicrobium sp. TaxID=2029185 RepID=UPI002E37AFA6|nr:hypothetical protein [Longimicrobium sp.]HEX6037943.1 hypothetical protein [Longimicrobium sp.]
MATDQDAVRELLGPLADMPAPPSPDDRSEQSDPTGGIIPGTGRRMEDHQPFPPASESDSDFDLGQ